MCFESLRSIVVVCLCLSACAREPSLPSTNLPGDLVLAAEDEIRIEAEVRQAFANLADAATALEIDRYVTFFDRPRFTALNADGTVTHSFDTFEATVRQQFAGLASYRSLDFQRVKVTVIDPTTAILVNEYQAEVIVTGGDVVAAAGAGTQVWTLTDGGWKLVSVSSSARP